MTGKQRGGREGEREREREREREKQGWLERVGKLVGSPHRKRVRNSAFQWYLVRIKGTL